MQHSRTVIGDLHFIYFHTRVSYMSLRVALVDRTWLSPTVITYQKQSFIVVWEPGGGGGGGAESEANFEKLKNDLQAVFSVLPRAPIIHLFHYSFYEDSHFLLLCSVSFF